MKHCTECGSVLELNWDFCKSCGHAILKLEAPKTISANTSDLLEKSSAKPTRGLKKISFFVLPILAFVLLALVISGNSSSISHYATFEELKNELVQRNICTNFEPAGRKDELKILVVCKTNKKYSDGSGFLSLWVNFNSDIKVPVSGWQPTSRFYKKIPQTESLKYTLNPRDNPTVVGENWVLYDPIPTDMEGKFYFTKAEFEAFAKTLGGKYISGNLLP
jgi:hypothetical protein